MLTSALQLDDGDDAPPTFDAHDEDVLHGAAFIGQ